MPSMSVRYLGLPLTSPIVLSSSSLTNTVNGVRRAAEAGAGAVVLKSLFEEQISTETPENAEQVDYSIHPEAEEYIRQMGKHLGPETYLRLIREAKQAVDIPVIASVNCVTPRWWGDYAKQIESAGADAIELNIAIMPRGGRTPEEVESSYLRIVEQVRKAVNLPIAVKIGPYFTSLPRLTDQLQRAGAGAIVMFNRFYQLDIDVEKLELAGGYQFSSPQELHTPLRWISVLAGGSPSELVGSTGVHTGEDVVKMLLAGATAVQVCSTVYRNGYERITEMNRDLAEWMRNHDFEEIAAFRGRLSQSGSSVPEAYERLQYIKALTGLA
ncbi:MAG: dihydroorotate dehydrogenase-like protein [Spirochaetota bacterium]